MFLSPVQSAVAIRHCLNEERGFVRHKCFYTNDRSRGYWQKAPDFSDCVQSNLVLAEKHVSMLCGSTALRPWFSSREFVFVEREINSLIIFFSWTIS